MPANTEMSEATADDASEHAWRDALRGEPQSAARVAADWLLEIAERLSSGRPLDALHDIWPLLLVEAKVAELVRSVSTAALWEAETHIFGAPLKRL